MRCTGCGIALRCGVGCGCCGVLLVLRYRVYGVVKVMNLLKESGIQLSWIYVVLWNEV